MGKDQRLASPSGKPGERQGPATTALFEEAQQQSQAGPNPAPAAKNAFGREG
jgi:hypothetical protein